MKNSKNCVNLVFWSFVAPPGLSPDQIGHSKQKTGTLSFDTPKYMKIPNSQSWIHPISCTSPQMGSHQKFHSLNKLISKNFFSKIKILTHPYKSYVTIKNMFSHQISHIIMYSPLFWVPGVTLLRLLRCTNMVHFASSKEHSGGGQKCPKFCLRGLYIAPPLSIRFLMIWKQTTIDKKMYTYDKRPP